LGIHQATANIRLRQMGLTGGGRSGRKSKRKGKSNNWSDVTGGGV